MRYVRDMETDKGSGGHTCGETTANLTRDDYKQCEILSSFRQVVMKGAVMLSSGNSFV